jgi:hypothetical protein
MTNIFTYDGVSRPKWQKVFTAADGETFSVYLVFDNLEERQSLTVEESFTHMENLVRYLKDQTNMLDIVGFNDPTPQSRYPFSPGYEEIDWVLNEITRWWSWAYYNEAFDETEAGEGSA